MSVARLKKTAPSVEIYAHKLFAPPGYQGAILRTAILDKIFAKDRARIVFLQAPAGHGKSTLLQQAKSVCETEGMRTSWLTFDDADNDIRRFSIHFQALLAAALGTITDAAVVLQNDAPVTSARRTDWIINRLTQFGRPVGLFLDELQSITNKVILAFFRDLFDHLPENAMIFVGSRSTPEIGLSRLVVNKQALILSSDDLRFSAAETTQFFSEAQHLWINEDELKSIYRKTEGWPAALQLFRLTLINPSVRKALGDLGTYRPRELAEYLADNVLALQPQHIQEFLLKTSLLPRLCASLCNATTGRHDSQEILLHLERSGLFLRSLDPGLHWFKYHALFSSFLSEQLRHASEDTVIEVHRRAAAWNRKHSFHEDAAYHSVEIQDYGSAADVMNDWFTQLISVAQLITVERWYEHLPLAEIEKRPDLAIKIAYALVFLRRDQKLRPILEILQRRKPKGDIHKTTDPNVACSMAAIEADDIASAFNFIQKVNVRDPHSEGFSGFELGAGANLAAYFAIAEGDHEAARELQAHARAHNERSGATFSGGYTFGITGINLMAQGLLDQALERFRVGMAEQRFYLDKSFASAALVSCYILALYEANELDEAEALFTQFHETIAEAVLLDFLAVAYISVARIHDARGRPGKALEILEEAENIGHTSHWPRLIRIVNRERVRRALFRGELGRAESIAGRTPKDSGSTLPQGWILFSEEVDDDAIGTIRLAIHQSQAELAQQLIARELTMARAKGRVRRQIKLLLLDALAHKSKGVDNTAHRSLRDALRLAEPGQFIRTFLDEGEGVVNMLHEEYQALAQDSKKYREADFGVSAGFIETLLKAAGINLQTNPAEGSAQAPDTLTEALTEREKKILIYLSNGVSNKEMARKIFVSENTVKFHLKNIYSKLSVSSRLQAINAARQMGII